MLSPQSLITHIPKEPEMQKATQEKLPVALALTLALAGPRQPTSPKYGRLWGRPVSIHPFDRPRQSR